MGKRCNVVASRSGRAGELAWSILLHTRRAVTGADAPRELTLASGREGVGATAPFDGL
jgi:hypothetical protein